ncbi:bifunctional Succinate dehydogenase-fumarate reductase N-terminal/4Fe-4S ferredoxin-type [Babesia duncani]|uniref:Succinate dehydrogenase [ubiquinone] iron-sulfur subunit, mitochondrial n=1 Tax=Babesia duncani TaxID=323732 RepID=A0AAD9PM42_9APIC|nr:bifunctional Succinate dehydogenase-fumarate reductase N-terminal/4Fe-4S ferredoxin-type [Babesia duncani]
MSSISCGLFRATRTHFGPQMVDFSIFRFSPGSKSRPRMETHKLDISTCGPMVLDALIKIKNEIDPTLSFRRSCREGICGSCAMNINGENSLACLTEIAPMASTTIEIQPLPGLYVLRDLVPDMTNFYQQYKFIKPWLQRKEPKQDDREYIQTREERAKLDGMYECILCACCSTSCPSYWWNPEHYLGPAALLQAYRWISDSRDQYKVERMIAVNDTMKLYRCHGIQNCTKVCPKGLDPATKIRQLKIQICNEMDQSWHAIAAKQYQLESPSPPPQTTSSN